MASEAFDWPVCSAVVLATPFTAGVSLQQAVGRAQRSDAPVTVVDFIDASPALGAAAERRRRWFRGQAFQITTH